MNIPSELLDIPHWVAWKYETIDGSAKPTKVPYNFKNGQKADVTNPNDWNDVREVNSFQQHCAGLGFVLTDLHRYTVIDLDDPFARADGTAIHPGDEDYEWAIGVYQSHLEIIRAFDSYTEWSPSGKGAHIWLRGKLPPDWGKRAGKVEIYSRVRFMTMTGNHIKDTPTTINERQGVLEVLAEKLGLGPKHNVNLEHFNVAETRGDGEVYDACLRATTADKFRLLWEGDIAGYPSHSEADQALANFICFQTDNIGQAERVFRASPHYAKREKLHRRDDLVSRAIRNGFDMKPPPVDTAAFLASATALRSLAPPAPIVTPEEPILSVKPPGLLGDIAEYIYSTAAAPQRTVALAGAIALLAGMAGRAFNVGGTGLNHYVVVIGETGTGKEGAQSGISRLIASVESELMGIHDFLGPGHFSSGIAVRKHLTDKRSFLAFHGEMGYWLQRHTGQYAGNNERLTVSVYLDLWNKSGITDTTGSIKYSDRDKDLPSVLAPAFSLIGDATQSSFFKAVTPESLSSGLIPRFLLIEVPQVMPDLNENGYLVKPNPQLINMFKAFAGTALSNINQNKATNVAYAPEAIALAENFRVECKANWAEHDTEANRAMWARANQKMRRLAALVAVGASWYHPVISLWDVQWAIAFIRRDIRAVLGRHEAGELATGLAQGSIDPAQRYLVQKMYRYINTPWPVPGNHSGTKAMHKMGMVPLRYLRQQLSGLKPFVPTHVRTAGQLIDACIKEAVEVGLISEMADPNVFAANGYGNAKPKHYTIADIPGAKYIAGEV